MPSDHNPDTDVQLNTGHRSFSITPPAMEVEGQGGAAEDAVERHEGEDDFGDVRSQSPNAQLSVSFPSRSSSLA